MEAEYATVSVIRDDAGPFTTSKALVDKDDPKLLVPPLPVLVPSTLP